MVKITNHVLIKWLQLVLLIVFVVGLSWVFLHINTPQDFSENTTSNSHYISNSYPYLFSDSTKVIEIGVQPLWVPAAIITQLMEHDLVLEHGLSELGYSIRFYPYFNGSDLMKFIGTNNLEGGVASIMPILLSLEESKLEVVAPIQEGFTSIVSSKISMIEDLENKRIGFVYGTNSHSGLLSSLILHGIDPQNVDLIPLKVDQMSEELHLNNIVAFSASEPIPSMSLHKYADQVVINRSFSLGFLFFNQSFYLNNKEAANLIVAAEIRAFNWLQLSRNNLLKGVGWSFAESKAMYSSLDVKLTNYQVATLAKKDFLKNVDFPGISNKYFEEGGSIFNEFQILRDEGFVSSSVQYDDMKSAFNLFLVSKIKKNAAFYQLHEFNYDPNYDVDLTNLKYD